MPKFLSDGIFDGSSTDLIVDGKVGIKTVNPSRSLHVKGTAGIGTVAKFESVNDVAYIQISSSGQSDANSGYIGHDSSRVMYFLGNTFTVVNSATGEKIRIDSSGNMGINTTNPSQKLHVSGNARITGAIYDSNNLSGTSGQVLSSTVTGIDWIDQGDVIAGEADKAKSVILRVKNSTASPMTKGQVICEAVSASPPNGNLIEVALADNNGTNTMPALGILNEDLDAAGGNNDEGDAIMFGKVSGIDTSAFDVGDEVFVSDTPGGLTITKPTGVKYIQKVGVVIRDDNTNGTIEVFGAGRVNDVPTPLYVDHANQRLGIGTTSPNATLKVQGPSDTATISTSSTPAARINNGGAISLWIGSNFYNYGYVQSIQDDGSNNLKRLSLQPLGGDVGIGTTSPSQKLDVNGNIISTSGSGNFIRSKHSVSAFAQLESNSSGGIVKGSGGNGFLIRSYGDSYFNGGNVGIGTTSPIRDLQIKKSNSGGQVRAEIFNTSNTANSNGVLSIYSGGSSAGDPFLHWKIDAVQDWSMGIDNSDSDKLKISKNFGPGVNDYLTIDTSGNVGIGTTSPENILHLKSPNPYLILEDTSNANKNRIANVDGNMHYHADYNNQMGNSRHIFYIDNSEKLRINTNGNVGIGTTSPSQKLHVNGATQVDNGGLLLGGTSSVNGNNPQLRRANSSNDLRIATAGSDRMTILGTGKVGIGTTAPVDILHVDGARSNFNGIKIGENSTNIQFIDDGKLAVGNNDWLIFTEGGQEFMRAGGQGNVGIGTTSPSNKLDVNGNIEASRIILPTTGTAGGGTVTTPAGKLDIRSDSTWSNSAIIARTTTNQNPVLAFYRPSGGSATSYPWWLEANGSTFQIKTGSAANIGSETVSTKVTINSSGNVGIGTTNPTSKLTVVDDILLSGSSPSLTLTDATSSFVIKTNTSGEGILQTSGTSKPIRFFRNNGSNESMRINGDGNVGIGTTSPAAKLEVEGSDHLFQLSTAATAGSPYLSFNQAGTRRSFIQHADSGDTLKLASEYGGIDFYTGTSGSETEKMTIQSNGNVGIGITAPVVKLHIGTSSGSGSTTEEFRIQTGTGAGYGGNAVVNLNTGAFGKSGIYFGNNGSLSYANQDSFLEYDDFSGQTKLNFGNTLTINKGTSSAIYIDSFGKVGLGTTSPQYQLQLSTNSAAKPTSSSWTVVSDERVKTNIRPYETGLQELLQIEPKLFDYNGKAGFDATTKNNIGVIAQEIKDVMPETVKKYNAKLNEEDEEDTELYNFDSHALTFALINSVKELNAKIKNLETKIQTLENQ